MTKVVSIINLKGGVAKTTTTVQLAECLAFAFEKKVLVIDLDPQTNATVALIGEEKWQQLDKSGQTVYQLFKDKLDGTNVFNSDKAIVHNVSNLNKSGVSLLPSSMQLIDIQDSLQEIAQKTRHVVSPIEVIKSKIQSEFTKYDYVLIDCPPNLGYITQNGIEISDFYLIPTIPDSLSTYGIPQIISNIHTLSSDRSLKIQCLGLLFTKYQSNSRIHKKFINQYPIRFNNLFIEKGIKPPPIFETVIPQSNITAESTEYTNEDNKVPRTFIQKYGSGYSSGVPLYEYVVRLTREFIKYAG